LSRPGHTFIGLASGHEFILDNGLVKDLVLGLDYYRAERIAGDKQPRDLLQVDVVVKF